MAERVPLDFGHLLISAEGDQRQVRQQVDEALSTLPEQMARLEGLMADGATDSIALQAQRLWHCLLHLAASDAAMAARKLHEAARTGNLSSTRRAFTRLSREMDVLLDTMETWMLTKAAQVGSPIP